MAKIGRFDIMPAAGESGTHTVKISVPNYYGRKKPQSTSVVARKVNGGLEKYLTIEQQPAGEYFNIDSIVKETKSSGITELTIVCSGNIPLKNISCGGLEYFGLGLARNSYTASSSPGAAKPWIVNYMGSDIPIYVQSSNEYGVVLAKVAEGLNYVGEAESYTLTAYLAAPKADTDMVYDFFFGKYSGNMNVPVSSVTPSDTLKTAGGTLGKITIVPPERGYVRVKDGTTQIRLENTDCQESGYLYKVYVESSGSWFIDPDSVEDWVVIGYPDISDAEYGTYFTVTASGPNTATDNRWTNIDIKLVSDESICWHLGVYQGQASASWLHLFFTEFSTYKDNPLMTSVPSEGGSSNLIVYAGGPWTMNEDSFPNWIHLGSRYNGTGQYNKIIDTTFDPIGSEDRQFDIVATLTDTGETYTRTVRQEVPVSVFVTGGGNMPYYEWVPDVYSDAYGHVVFVRSFQAQAGEPWNYRIFTLEITASGPWTAKAGNNTEILSKTDTSITFKVTRNNGGDLFKGTVVLYTNNDIARTTINTFPSDEYMARVMSNLNP